MPQKYGPKKNTRRARGYRRRDLGHRHKCKSVKFEDLSLPSEVTLRRYIFIYNCYVRHVEIYNDPIPAIDATTCKFGVHKKTVYNAISACKKLQKLRNESNDLHQISVARQRTI